MRLSGMPLALLRAVVALSLALAAASFVGLWAVVGFALYRTSLFGWRPLDWLAHALGGVAVLAVSWLLFPAVLTMVMGFFIGRVADSVEALDYPGQPPARRAPIFETAAVTLRLMSLTLLLNLLALPLYLLAPGLNLFVFLGLNGYLFGREYFEAVALRRLDPAATRRMRQRFAGRLLLGGAVIAGIFALPVVNLVAPVIATAFMVHLFERWRRIEPLLGAP
jgi:uncharacterized protein involved in cysteine biosynthesis